LISLVGHKEPGRVLRKAVMDDATPAKSGTVIEYWRGPVEDMSTYPRGKKGEAFRHAWLLHEFGRVWLFQKRTGEDEFSYMAVVK
jgi:hypothetical protein